MELERKRKYTIWLQ